MIKRLCLICILFLFILVSKSFAAGTVTQTLDKYPNINMQVLTFSWVGDAANGTVPSTATSTAITTKIAGWYVYSIETNPGSPAPTAAYDIVITNAEELDIAGGTLMNRHGINTERIIPKIDTANAIFGSVLIDSALTLTITNQSVNSARGTVKLIMSNQAVMTK